jgi:hypothetical protein
MSPSIASAQSDIPAVTSIDAYTTALDASQTPLLGYVVVYSIYDRRIKREELERWFDELALDPAFLPPPIRPVDAFEKVTGPTGVRASYSLDPAADPKRRPAGKIQEATLMVRHVRRDEQRIIRHLIREVRDETKTSLNYDSRLADCVFLRGAGQTAEAGGGGTLEITPIHAAISELPSPERANVHSLLQKISDSYARHCVYLTGDRVRSLIRAYVENLNAIKVRPTGGVYFVHHIHADTLARLRELTDRMGAGSYLARIPIPDVDEMREMVINAFTTKAKEDLDKLAVDIAAAQTTGASKTTTHKLYRRYQALQASTSQHSELLSTSLDDTDAALHLVQIQLSGLLAATD